MHDCYYPRLLFITTSAFNKVTGGGITFSNLFYGWPKDCLSTIHNDPVPVSYEICSNYYKLGLKEIDKKGILRWIYQAISPHNKGAEVIFDNNPSVIKKILRSIKDLIYGDSVPENVQISHDLSLWIAEFRPEVIYTILGSNSMMELVIKVSNQFNVPVIIHMMDDWPEVICRGGMVSFIERTKMNNQLNQIIHKAVERLSICEAMSSEYQKRYGVSFSSFQNTIDTRKWNAYAKQDLFVQGEIKLVYSGSIFKNAQLDSLVDCARAVSKLNKTNIKIKLEIYSPTFFHNQFSSKFGADESVELHANIEDDRKYFELLQSADILIIPVNFDFKTIRYIQYSMPTKVPAYLLSGTPILVYGPNEVAQVKYASSAGWGHVISNRNQAKLMGAICQLATDNNLRKSLSNQARKTAVKNHDCQKVRTLFQETLREVEGLFQQVT